MIWLLVGVEKRTNSIVDELTNQQFDGVICIVVLMWVSSVCIVIITCNGRSPYNRSYIVIENSFELGVFTMAIILILALTSHATEIATMIFIGSLLNRKK